MREELIERIDAIQNRILFAADPEHHKMLQRMQVLLGDCKSAIVKLSLEKAITDALVYGTGVMQDGKHIPAGEVFRQCEGESSPQAAVPDVGAIIDYAIENDWCYPHECAIEDRVLDVRAVGKLKALLSAGKGGE